MRQSWTDDRLDEFRDEVVARFDEVDHCLELVDERFELVDERFALVSEQFVEQMDRFEERFSSWERTIVQLGTAAIVTCGIGFIGVIATLVAALLLLL